MGGAVFSKSLIQFSVDGKDWELGASRCKLFQIEWINNMVLLYSMPVIDLGPNYGGGNEDNGDLPQKIPCMHCYTQCPQPCSWPTHASAGDSWALLGKSGSVSCGVTAPFSWFLVHTRFCLCPPRVYSLVLCKFWQLYVGFNGDLLQ